VSFRAGYIYAAENIKQVERHVLFALNSFAAHTYKMNQPPPKTSLWIVGAVAVLIPLILFGLRWL
jgi:hypothetical protein